jgi:hypothetical protein
MLLNLGFDQKKKDINTTQTNQQTEQEESVKHLDGTVEVSFRIDVKGKVEIVNIQATHPQLADYVIQKLNRIQLNKSESGAGQIIHYRFVFRKQA